MKWYEGNDLLSEWDFEKNEGIDYSKCTAQSHKVVFWKCSKGHSFAGEIRKRVIRGDGCPYCSGRRVIPGKTDLASVRPHIASEWDYERNTPLLPSQMKEYSNVKVYWLCQKGHSYEARIGDRTKGSGCPYCAGKLPIIGETDFASRFPNLLKEWDYSKNDKAPEEYTYGSKRNVFWICDKGHSYSATIKHRSHGTGCPYCSHRIVLQGETDLKTIAPNIAAEWDYEKNCELPEEITAYSNKKVYWICKQGHSWRREVYSRTLGNGCPYCAGYWPVKGKTDLETLRPDLAAEWNYELNRFKPCEYTVSSNKRVYWTCSKGHTWKTGIDKRSFGYGCPECYRLQHKSNS